MQVEKRFSQTLLHFSWLGRGREGVRSTGGALYWLKCIAELDKFVHNEDGVLWLLLPRCLYGQRTPGCETRKAWAAQQCLRNEPNKMSTMKKRMRTFQSRNSTRRRKLTKLHQLLTRRGKAKKCLLGGRRRRRQRLIPQLRKLLTKENFYLHTSVAKEAKVYFMHLPILIKKSLS